MREVRVADLGLDDVVMDPQTDRNPNADGSSDTVRVLAWCDPAAPGEVAFTYMSLSGPNEGLTDWASYRPDERLVLVDHAD